MKSEKTELKINKKDIEELKRRLLDTRFPDEDEKIISSDSVSLKNMKKLIKYWADEYDMESIENKYNSMPLYRIKNKDSWVYYNRTGNEDNPGLLMIHGWPDSSLAYLKSAKDLGKEYDVIIPEIPGFGPGGPITGSDIKK